MSHENPDPSPEETPGLEAGGSVCPGDTPPAESSTPGATDRQPDLPRARANKVVYGVIVAVALLVVVMLVGYVVGLVG